MIFYVVDVGAGRFQWVDSILRFLKNNPNVPKNKKYHIIGLNVDGVNLHVKLTPLGHKVACKIDPSNY